MLDLAWYCPSEGDGHHLGTRAPERPPTFAYLVAVTPAAVSPALAAHQAETLERIAPGRIAINLVAGGGPADGYGHAQLAHDERYARLAELAGALRRRF